MSNLFLEQLNKIPKGDLFIRRGIEYPFHLYTSDFEPKLILNKNLFVSTLDKTKFKLPPEIIKVKEEVLASEKERYLSLGRKWYNDELCRLSKIEIDHSGEEEKVFLEFQKTDYEDHYVSNLNIDSSVLDSERKTIREKFAPSFEDILNLNHSKLSNPLGTSIFVANPQTMTGVVGVRSKFVSLHRGYFAIAGGQMIAKSHLDVVKDKPNPFISAAREAQNEFNGYVSQDDLLCLGIGVDLIFGHPNILFLAQVNYDTKEIIEYPRKERAEFSDFYEVDLTNPKELQKYLDPSKISPNNATCIMLSVEHLLPDIYFKNRARPQALYAWKKDFFKTDYSVELICRPNGKGKLIIDKNDQRIISLTEQQTQMLILMINKLKTDSKVKDHNLGYVFLREFMEDNVSGWNTETDYTQVYNQILKIRKKLDSTGFERNLIETLTNMSEDGQTMTTYRFSTYPDRIVVHNS